MCMFCAAIPVVAASGAALQGKQVREKQAAQAAGKDEPAARPIKHITAAVVVLLLAGSVTYHTLTYLP